MAIDGGRDTDPTKGFGLTDTLGAAVVLEGPEYFPDKVVNPRHATRHRRSSAARAGGLGPPATSQEEGSRSVFDSRSATDEDPNAASMMAEMYARGDLGLQSLEGPGGEPADARGQETPSAQPDGPGSYSVRSDSDDQLEDRILDRSESAVGHARPGDRSLTTNVECYDGLIRDEVELNAILYDSRYYYDAGDVQVRGRREESQGGSSAPASDTDSGRGSVAHRRQATEEAISLLDPGEPEAGAMFQKVTDTQRGRQDLPPKPRTVGDDDWSLGTGG